MPDRFVICHLNVPDRIAVAPKNNVRIGVFAEQVQVGVKLAHSSCFLVTLGNRAPRILQLFQGIISLRIIGNSLLNLHERRAFS
ncbi:hypothetical protein DDQ68_08785 [Hymenobacter nivis]|uniref:Uncharacterized protein n=1 Tax=Hymenobacter nivis TaxID=1850093 RepID=A0A2Z3GMA0_9BACT|nr:hypothetical protein DDQ68_08785 [Hymenobacter nivis]